MTLPNDEIGGKIGQAHYDQWRTHFGQTGGIGAGAISNSAVPEPTTLVLMMAPAACYIRRCRAA
jgi:hypothetical protein